MKIEEILKKESVIADLLGDSKVKVIKEMTQCLKKNNFIKNDQALFETLMEREKLGSTGIGENVAIPHGKSDEVTQIITVLARSKKGVEFESLDQKPVHFVCMVIAPAHSTGQHLKVLARAVSYTHLTLPTIA